MMLLLHVVATAVATVEKGSVFIYIYIYTEIDMKR